MLSRRIQRERPLSKELVTGLTCDPRYYPYLYGTGSVTSRMLILRSRGLMMVPDFLYFYFLQVVMRFRPASHHFRPAQLYKTQIIRSFHLYMQAGN